ncbi:DUF7344 domain-containing protein [Haloarcula litorea]|uniref:DUF7344 domain-containing protein n=1 Tax=Haloarcula litorea TaxID=3032579 RepID=UPI0023E8BFF0|nr:hypothetical protein [Halomicroarcula sp. GDY20]
MSKARSGGLTEESPRPTTEQDQSEETLSRDETFEMLSNRRRRYALHCLQDTAEPVTLSDLAEQVAAWENDSTVAELSASERKTVYTSLQQFHLPKMDDTGVVEFDDRAGEVALTDAAADLDIYLEVVERYDIPWSFYYIGFSAIGVTLVTLSWLGVGPFAAVPYVGWTVFLLAALLVSSVSHYLLTRRMRLGRGDTPPEVRDG